MATGTLTSAEKIERLRLNVQSCASRRDCTSPNATCVAGVHLYPSTLSSAGYLVYETPSGAVSHTDQSCPALRGNGAPINRTWPDLQARLCRSCGRQPAEIDAVATEARRISASLATIERVARTWPGRTQVADLASVEAAAGKLAKARLRHLRGLADLAVAVADLLTATSVVGWTPPPVPDRVLGAASADLIGVDDDPFYRAGQRPRTALDRDAAEVASASVLESLWTGWRRHAGANGLDAVQPLALLGRRAGHRGRRQTLVALLEAWTDLAADLGAAGAPEVVALPTQSQAMPREEPVRGSVIALVSQAAVAVPQSAACLVVVPQVVARWLARHELTTFERIGPWSGDAHGVATLEALVKLTDGDVHRMPDLLTVAGDLTAGALPADRAADGRPVTADAGT